MNEKDKERFLFSLIDDRRIPASDVMGMLADCQVRKTQLNMIAEEVDKNWPGVCAIHAGEYKSRLYFNIQINPFSKDLQREHWALGKIIKTITGNNNFSCFYLPKIEENPYSSEIRIYKRK